MWEGPLGNKRGALAQYASQPSDSLKGEPQPCLTQRQIPRKHHLQQ